MAAILELQELSKTLPSVDRPILFNNVTAIVSEPMAIGLIGMSGQGKSTLLRILGMLDTCEEGNLIFKGQSSKNWSPMEWRKQIAYVSQQAIMLPGSVEDNLRMVSRLHSTPFNRDLALFLLEQVGLKETRLDKDASTCSGGEKQRLALIRSMMLEPEVLLLDEITSSLDMESKYRVENMLKIWRLERGTTLIWVTHDLEQARTCCDQIWQIANQTLLVNVSSLTDYENDKTKEVLV